MVKKYKIIERKGAFIVYTNKEVVTKRLFRPNIVTEEWFVPWKAIYSPAHFKKLENAKKWIEVQLKPDKEHGVFS
jgi:hypothetical protein